MNKNMLTVVVLGLGFLYNIPSLFASKLEEGMDNPLPIIEIQNPPKDTTVQCSAYDPTPVQIQALDNCPGDISVSVIEESTRSIEVNSCEFSTYTVTRIYSLTNDCDEVASHVQTITVIDTIGPHFDAPADVTVSCELSNDLEITGSIPLFTDDCGSMAIVSYSDEVIEMSCDNAFNRIWIASDACGNREERVQKITIIDTIPPSFTFVPQNISISCGLDSNPFNEFNTWVNNIGNAITTDNCSDVVSSFAALPGSYDINDPNTFPGIHPGALNEISCAQGGSVLQQEVVDFVIIDACGNANSATATFSFIDTIAPVIQDCSEMRTIELNGTSCDTSLIFDLPTASEACILRNITTTIFDEVQVASDTLNSLTLPVNDLNFKLGPFGPEIEFVDANFFIVKMNNIDAEHPDEVFDIFSEDEISIGNTINTTTQCGDTIFLIGPFAKTRMEQWASDGYIDFIFKARHNETQPENSINDICLDSRIRVEQTYIIPRSIEDPKFYYKANDALAVEVTGVSAGSRFGPGENIVQFIVQDCAGNTDFCQKTITIIDKVLPSVSCTTNLSLNTLVNSCDHPLVLGDIISIQDLCNEETQMSITITGNDAQSINGTFTELQDSIISFPTGTNTVEVVASDFSGNQDQCSFQITVSDVETPNAVCEEINLPVAAVELDNYAVNPSLVAGSSFDNCGIANIAIENNSYSCSDLNTTVGRVVRVTDNSGNTSSCIANFFFDNNPVPIDYTIGLCSFDSLKFQIGIPKRPNYTYRWEGPNNFFSAEAEPFIRGVQSVHQGIYSVTITNTASICQSFGAVVVDIDQAIVPHFTTDTIACATLPHRLESTELSSDVFYIWYEHRDGLLYELGRSEEPFIDILLEPGIRELLVRASNDECPSVNSNTIVVDIRPTPEGSICTSLLEGCIGDQLSLCVDSPQDDWIVRWTGPDGFESDDPNAIVTDSFAPVNAGIYEAVIEVEQCVTDTFTTAVTSNIKPPTPAILGMNFYCEGDTLILQSSIEGAGYIYSWQTPDGPIRSTESILRIPDAERKYSGTWTLSIEKDPCISDESMAVEVFIEPSSFEGIETIATQCEGAEIQLKATALEGATYQWLGPGNLNSPEESPIVQAQEGTYAVLVTSENGCRYTDAFDLNTVQVPEITAVASSTSENCIDPLTTITLVPEVIAEENVSYRWTGPGISSVDSELNLVNYTLQNNGTYTLQVANGECPSETFEFELEYLISPIKPIIDAESAACIGDSLIIISNSYDEGSIYFWNTPNGIISTDSNILNLGPSNPSQEGEYSLIISQGQCTSQTSDAVEVKIQQNDFVPEILKGGEECLGSRLELFTNLDPDLIIEWELPNGNFVTTDTLRINNAKVSNAGLYMARSFLNGCPSEWSSEVLVDIADPRTGVTLDEDFIFACNNKDALLEFCINDDGSVPGITYLWYTKGELLGETSALCFPVPDLSMFSIGVNQIELVLSYNNCLVPFDKILFLELEDVSDVDLDAGPDMRFCLNQELPMSAEEISSDKLQSYWEFDQNVVVSDPSDPFAIVQVVNDVSETSVVWTVEHSECGIIFRDSIILARKIAPEPVADTFDFDDRDLVFNPLVNDILLDNNEYELTEVSTPRWGQANINGEAINFRTDPQFVGGAIAFTYTVCDVECPDLCADGEVIVFYNQESCKGNNVLTANNDGVNDVFVIPCIDEENLPDNKLVILNEIGNTVFEQSPYDNSWEGTFNGETLPEGTYYYLFQKNENSSIIQGFIAIER